MGAGSSGIRFSAIAGVRQFPSPSKIGTISPGANFPKRPQLKEVGSSKRAHLRGGLWARLAYALIDMTCIGLNAVVVVYLRFVPGLFSGAVREPRFGLSPQFPISHYAAFLLLYVALLVLLCQAQDLYRTPRTRSAADETMRVVKAVSLATLLLVAFVFLSGSSIVSRAVVLGVSVLTIVTLSAWRFLKRRFVIRRAMQGIGLRNVLVVGAGAVGQALAQLIEENKLLGFKFRGFVDGDHQSHPGLLGKIEDLTRVARAEFVDDIFITIPSEREVVKRIALEAQQNRWNVKVVPDLYDGLGWGAPLHFIGQFPVMDLHWQPIPALGLFFKRVLDVMLAGLGLVLFAPVMLVVGILVRLDTPGPIFYRSHRVGRKGQLFTCYKFRTMVANADALKKGLWHLNERKGPFFKITNDPRVTPIGRFLRRYSLDELPQLGNVLIGNMSLVGPRPHTMDDYARYDTDQLRRLEVKPGVTGLWQVTARRDPSFETTMRLDLAYIENWNLMLDMKVLCKTIPAVFQGEGA
jgi:exopolysaccharide biosynthesis polyprenyl glycosylphosphotransferase